MVRYGIFLKIEMNFLGRAITPLMIMPQIWFNNHRIAVDISYLLAVQKISSINIKRDRANLVGLVARWHYVTQASSKPSKAEDQQ